MAWAATDFPQGSLDGLGALLQTAARIGDEARGEPSAAFGAAVAPSQPMAGGQLADAFEQGLLVGQVLHAQPMGESPLVQAPVRARMRDQPLDLGAEQDALAFHGIVEGLDAEGVARAEKLSCGWAIQSEREHAAQAVEHPFSPLLEPVEYHFRIALGGEGVTCGDQLPA